MTKWSCQRCTVRVHRLPESSLTGRPNGWTESADHGLVCLSCGRDLAVATAIERVDPKMVRSARVDALVEFELGRDPVPSFTAIARVARTTANRVRTIQASKASPDGMRASGRRAREELLDNAARADTQIAEIAGISPKTVGRHRAALEAEGAIPRRGELERVG